MKQFLPLVVVLTLFSSIGLSANQSCGVQIVHSYCRCLNMGVWLPVIEDIYSDGEKADYTIHNAFSTLQECDDFIGASRTCP